MSKYNSGPSDKAVVGFGCLSGIFAILFSIAVTAGTIAAIVWAVVWVLQTMGVL